MPSNADNSDSVALIGRQIVPGTKLRHSNGHVVTVSRRKSTDDGWWLTDSGGLSDRAIATGDWTFAEGARSR